MWRGLLVAAALTGTIASAEAGTVGQRTADEGQWVLVRVPFRGPAVIARWQERGWEVWSAHPEEGVDLLLPATEGQKLVRALGGRLLSVEQAPTPRWLSCYRSYASVEAELREFPGRYPHLAELRDAGPTWETLNSRGVRRRLWALRLTNLDSPGPKPVFLVIGLHHAREVVTPALSLALAQRLAAAYDVEPTLTWLLDTSEVWVLPVANPDGLMKVEARQNWRKNNNHDACGGQVARDGRGPGVDLNRNYGYFWGGRGASTDECDETYRGRGPFSEPETQALRDLISQLEPRLVISLHSYSELILYPFGYTKDPAPDEAGLRALARLCAFYPRYRPIPVHELYLASGDACDWVYGQMNVPCLTFEIGSARENYFWPTCNQLAAQVAANLPALVHASRLLAAPYDLALGPLADDVASHWSNGALTVKAVLDDRPTGAEPIAAAEVWLDEPGLPGTGKPMTIMPREDGRADAMAVLPIDELPTGRRWVFVRGQDSAGHWGPVGAGWLGPDSGVPSPTLPTASPTPQPTPVPPTHLPPVEASPTATSSPPSTETPLPTAEPSTLPSETAVDPSTPPPAATSPGPADRSGQAFLPLLFRGRASAELQLGGRYIAGPAWQPGVTRPVLLRDTFFSILQP